MQGDLAMMRPAPVFEEIDALPGPEREPAAEDRDRQADIGEGGADMGRHIVGAFVIMCVSLGVFWRDDREISFEIAANFERGV